MAPVPRSLEERLAEKFEIDHATGCWIWTAHVSEGGYGRICERGGGKMLMAHRAAYALFVEAIPPGLTLDHLCRNRRCVNPDHLEPVTMRENVLRGTGLPARNARKTHCDQGHEFTPENTYVSPTGGRECRICGRRKKRDHQRRKREAIAA